MAFKMMDLTPEDTLDMMTMMSGCLKTDELWQTLKGDATDESEIKFLIDWFGPRLHLRDNYEGWKIVETATRRMVAWAMLAKPHAVGIDNKAVLEGKPPTIPPGWNVAAAKEFEERLINVTKKHGYDPEQHYQRATTMIHPDFQRRGLGRWISARCNQSADRAGKVTWCRARPLITALLLKMGYELIEDVEIDLRKYGGNTSTHTYCLRRGPQPFGAAVKTLRD